MSVGSLVLLTWFGWVSGWRLTAEILLAAVAHELGHCAVLYGAGAKIRALRINMLGAVLDADCLRLSYGMELAAVLVGPGVNLLCGWGLARLAEPEWLEFAGVHLVLGSFNLLPVRPLDGGRAMELAVSWLAGPWWGEWAARTAGSISALLLAGGIGWLMLRSGGNLWLLPPLLAFLAAGGREITGKGEICQGK